MEGFAHPIILLAACDAVTGSARNILDQGYQQGYNSTMFLLGEEHALVLALPMPLAVLSPSIRVASEPTRVLEAGTRPGVDTVPADDMQRMEYFRSWHGSVSPCDDRRRPFTCCATWCASAAHVHMGLTPEAVGKAEVSATKSPGTSQVSPDGFTAPCLAEPAIRQVPIWCAEPSATDVCGMPAACKRLTQASNSRSHAWLPAQLLSFKGSMLSCAEYTSQAPAATRILAACSPAHRRCFLSACCME